MGNESFWSELGEYYDQILNMISFISKKSYISVTNMKSRVTWWSDRAVEFFRLESNTAIFTKEKAKVKIHPDDLERYRKEVAERYAGQKLNEPMEYRLSVDGGEYHVFSANSSILYDQAQESALFITVYENYGISDDIDYITGLHNEAVFVNELNLHIQNGDQVSILKFGIDKFSNINVMYGSNYANKILHSVAMNVQEMLETQEGRAYRLSGAKFAVIFKTMTREQLNEFYLLLDEMLADHNYIDGKKVPLRISGGAIILDSYFGDAVAIKSRLTYSLNHSKHAHHGTLVIFNDEICNDGHDNLEMLGVIHRCAVESFDGFYLRYQPIVDSVSGRINGMEALLRWKMEPFGEISPGVFIEWLEEDPCIYDLGNWILRQALTDAARIRRQKNQDFFVNVNVAAAQLERKEFRHAVMSVLEVTGFPANYLCLELTERCRELDVNFLKQEVEFFRSQGVKVAMDDFGTGNASLAVALDLPVDELKIDMSFVRNIQNKPNNQALVKSIVEYAKTTERKTCIEGVENAEVLECLKPYGATWYQGYYYSRPVTIQEFMNLM